MPISAITFGHLEPANTSLHVTDSQLINTLTSDLTYDELFSDPYVSCKLQAHIVTHYTYYARPPGADPDGPFKIQGEELTDDTRKSLRKLKEMKMHQAKIFIDSIYVKYDGKEQLVNGTIVYITL